MMWLRINNPNYSPFDDSGEYKYFCTHCAAQANKKTKYCAHCGERAEGIMYVKDGKMIEERNQKMNLDQLQKRKLLLESTIHKATEEKDEVEKQIDDIVLRKVKPFLARNKISFPELINLLNASEEERRIIFKILKREGKENRNETKEKIQEAD